MRSEHRMTGDEQDALTIWRRFLIWKPGERKAVKRQSHRKDRRAAKRQMRGEA